MNQKRRKQSVNRSSPSKIPVIILFSTELSFEVNESDNRRI